MPPECSLSLSSILVLTRCNHRATAATDNPAAFTELPRVTMLENEERIRVLSANPPGLLAQLLPQGYSDGTRSHATNHRSPLLLLVLVNLLPASYYYCTSRDLSRRWKK